MSKESHDVDEDIIEDINEDVSELDGSIFDKNTEIDEASESEVVESELLKDSEKEKKEFEKEIKDYPVLGEDKSIFEMRKKGLFHVIGSRLSDVVSKLSPSNIIYNVKKTIKKGKDDEGETEEHPKKDDEFILEGFEGVYYNSSKTISKKQILNYAYIVVGVILFSLILFLAGKFIVSTFSNNDGVECPFECCINDSYEDKLCPGFATCQSNVCVLPDCPEHYECCPQDLYNAKPCPNEYYECSPDFECVQKDCPFECCTTNDPYREKDCLDGGNCINNKCFFEPCPYECCIDDIGYDDKPCSETQLCVDNVCRSRLLERIKGFVSILITALRVIFG